MLALRPSVAALFIISLTYILFAIYILRRKKISFESWLFFIFALGIAIWNSSMALIESRLVVSKTYVVILDRLTYFPIPILFLAMIYYLVSLRTDDFISSFKRNKFLWFITFLGVVNLILIPTNLISQNPGIAKMTPGPLMPFWGFFVGLSILYVLFLCVFGILQTEGEMRRNFYYILMGSILSGTGGLFFNIILPLLGYSAYPIIGGIYSLFVVFFMGFGVAGFYTFGLILSIVSAITFIFLFSIIVLALVGIVFLFLIYVVRGGS